MTQLFTHVSSFVECIIATASKLVTFVMAEGHEIALLGCIAALVFGILGAARSFIKGV